MYIAKKEFHQLIHSITKLIFFIMRMITRGEFTKLSNVLGQTQIKLACLSSLSKLSNAEGAS